jgi:alkanesulfonate monooxygenase SsuD/methylene tetrahydromethanopterin reductase-like flavin-dependent oxidoreductase (luciferase family)
MRSRVEFWCQPNGFPGTTAPAAERAEADGWDGLSVPDSQNLTGDPYVALALAASVTSNLLLRPRVTNPFTRHPAVTAASIFCLTRK